MGWWPRHGHPADARPSPARPARRRRRRPGVGPPSLNWAVFSSRAGRRHRLAEADRLGGGERVDQQHARGCGRAGRASTGSLHITPDDEISEQAGEVPAAGVGVEGPQRSAWRRRRPRWRALHALRRSIVSSSSSTSRWRSSRRDHRAAWVRSDVGGEPAGAVHQRAGRQTGTPGPARAATTASGRRHPRRTSRSGRAHGAGGADEVVLAPHHALGHAGGAAGVEHEDVVAGAAPGGLRALGGGARPRPRRARPSRGTSPSPSSTQSQVAHLGTRSRMRSTRSVNDAVEHDGDGIGVVPQVGELVVERSGSSC